LEDFLHVILHFFVFVLQRFGSQTNGLCRHQAHGFGRKRVWLRGRVNALDELRLAECVRNITASRPGFHGRSRRNEGRPWSHESFVVRLTGKAYFYILCWTVLEETVHWLISFESWFI
jgi:hypothetical protein